jgi:hypothetical protein
MMRTAFLSLQFLYNAKNLSDKGDKSDKMHLSLEYQYFACLFFCSDKKATSDRKKSDSKNKL